MTVHIGGASIWSTSSRPRSCRPRAPPTARASPRSPRWQLRDKTAAGKCEMRAKSDGNLTWESKHPPHLGPETVSKRAGKEAGKEQGQARAPSASRQTSSKPKSFRGLSSGVLYQRNHSRTPVTTPGQCSSMSATQFSLACTHTDYVSKALSLQANCRLARGLTASGSDVAMTSSFQSSSPSSIIANTPSGLTGVIEPISSTTLPIKSDQK